MKLPRRERRTALFTVGPVKIRGGAAQGPLEGRCAVVDTVGADNGA
jgi:hypothetical protein